MDKKSYPLFSASLVAVGLPEPTPEHRFAPPRRWRIDFAWPDEKLAVEIDGGLFTGGRHARGVGMVADMEKSNALTLGGWSLLRFTPSQVNNGEAIRWILVWFEHWGKLK